MSSFYITGKTVYLWQNYFMKPVRIINALLLLALISCGYTTSMTGTWKASPDKTYTFASIAVISGAHNLEARKMIEEQVEQKLIREGFNAEAGIMFLPPNATKDNISPEIVKEFLSLNGFDAVIVIRLLSKEDTRRYVPGSYTYAPVYGTSFYDYYGQMYNYAYTSGYMTGSVYFFLETNLFTYPEGDLIWSGQSETYDVTDLRKSADIFSEVLVSEMVKSGVMTP